MYLSLQLTIVYSKTESQVYQMMQILKIEESSKWSGNQLEEEEEEAHHVFQQPACSYNVLKSQFQEAQYVTIH